MSCSTIDNRSGANDVSAFSALLTGGALPFAGVTETFIWNAENRLVEVRPTQPQFAEPEDPNDRATWEAPLKVTFGYDYQGRRVYKRVYLWDPNDPNDPNDGYWQATPTRHVKYLWDGWRMLMELDGLNDDAVIRKYTWSLDLCGS